VAPSDERLTKAAENLCARTQSAGVFTPGGPVKTPATIMAASPGRWGTSRRSRSWSSRRRTWQRYGSRSCLQLAAAV